LQESELVTEKSKNRLDISSEELERVLLQKEGESFKDSAVQARSQGANKRALGKAVAKGGLLLKGKNPGNVRIHISVMKLGFLIILVCRFKDKKMTLELAFRVLLTRIAKPSQIHKRQGKSTSTSSCHEYYELVRLPTEATFIDFR
jgi:hypothetical protein